MRKYALVNNFIVTGIIEIENDEYNEYIKTNNSVIDIQDMNPQPQLGWVLNGNELQFPIGISDREKLEEQLAEKKIVLGINLVRMAIVKIGARNKILNKNSTQIASVLNNLLPIKLLLENGALGTAREACNSLKLLYTEYSDIFNLVIEDINNFENKYGL